MSNFSLDDIRAAAEKKYGSTFIEVGSETVELVNVLRLQKEKRKKLVAIQEAADKENSEEVDVEETLTESLRLVARTPLQAETLLEAIDGDLALLSEIFESYSGDSDLGEASGSES